MSLDLTKYKDLVPWIPAIAAFLPAFVTPFIVEHAKAWFAKAAPDERRIKNCHDDLEAERKARLAAEARADKLEERNAKLRDDLDECDENRRTFADHLYDCPLLREAHAAAQTVTQAKKQKSK